MVRKPIREALASIFRLPVVEDLTQTNVEQVIAYNLASSPIAIRVNPDQGLRFELDLEILFRCPNGYPGIGFLSHALTQADKQIGTVNFQSVDGEELVTYESTTEMIISKTVHALITIEYDAVREVIKSVNFEDDLACQKSY